MNPLSYPKLTQGMVWKINVAEQVPLSLLLTPGFRQILSLGFKIDEISSIE